MAQICAVFFFSLLIYLYRNFQWGGIFVSQSEYFYPLNFLRDFTSITHEFTATIFHLIYGANECDLSKTFVLKETQTRPSIIQCSNLGKLFKKQERHQSQPFPSTPKKPEKRSINHEILVDADGMRLFLWASQSFKSLSSVLIRERQRRV